MGSIECELFAKPVAALLSYWVLTTELSSAEIVARECAAIEALRESAQRLAGYADSKSDSG